MDKVILRLLRKNIFKKNKLFSKKQGFVRVGTDGDSVVGMTLVTDGLSGGAMPPAELPVLAFRDCTRLPFSVLMAQSCNTVDVVLPANVFGARPGDVYDMTVNLPLGLCPSAALPLAIVGTPVYSQEPLVPAVCDNGVVQQLEFLGDWFVRIAGPSGAGDTSPVLTRQPAMTTTPLSQTLDQCDAVVRVGSSFTMQRCKRALVSVSSPNLAGTRQFSIRHDNPRSIQTCNIVAQRQFAVVAEPTVVSASPQSICLGGANANITVTGSFDTINGLSPVIQIGGVSFPSREARGCGAVNAVGVASCTTIETRIDPTLAGGLSAGPLDIVVAVTPQVFLRNKQRVYTH